jgi:hypothetical protein
MTSRSFTCNLCIKPAKISDCCKGVNCCKSVIGATEGIFVTVGSLLDISSNIIAHVTVCDNGLVEF